MSDQGYLPKRAVLMGSVKGMKVEYRFLSDEYTGGTRRVGAFIGGRLCMVYKAYCRCGGYILRLYPVGFPNEAPKEVKKEPHDISVYEVRRAAR